MEHKTVPYYSCSVCGKNFKTRCTRDRHFLIHSGQKDYKCSFCNKAFSLKHHLKQHLTCHTGQKDFICHVCERPFSRKDSLKNHIWTVHSRVQTEWLSCNQSNVPMATVGQKLQSIPLVANIIWATPRENVPLEDAWRAKTQTRRVQSDGGPLLSAAGIIGYY